MANPQWLGCDAEPANGSGASTAGYSYAFDETCLDAGYITKIEVYVATIGALDVAVFSKSGSVFTDDHAVLGLTVATGLNEFTHANGDFDANDMPIAVGEYIGFYQASSGLLDKITTGGPGYWYDNGDQISGTPAGTTFSLSGNSAHEFQIRVYIEDTVPAGDPTVTDVETDEDYDDKDTALTITGTNFEASQGTGKVEMGDNADYATANKVTQTITSWADTAIDFTADLSTQNPGSKWIFVTNDTGNKNDPGFAVTVHRAQAFVMSLSSQFAPGATTAQLTAPATKTTADFDAGRIEEVANPCTAINITDDDYTEIEFCFKATDDAEDEQYDFRIVGVTSGVLDTYTVTPQLTISSATDINGTLGTVAVTGLNAAVTNETDISCTAGAVAVAGLNATVTNETDVNCTAGAVTAAALSATIISDIEIACTAGAATVAALNAAVTNETDINAGLATVTAAPMAAAVTNETDINCTLAAVAVAGLNAAVTNETDINCTLAAVAVAGLDALVTVGINVDCTAGAAVVAGLAATVQAVTAISCTAGTVAVAAPAATVLTDIEIDCTTGAAPVAALAAKVTNETDINCSLATVTVSALAATVKTTTAINCTAGALTVAALPAQVLTDILIESTTGLVVIAAYACQVITAVVTPGERTLLVTAENRILTVGADGRTLEVEAENRTLAVGADGRTLEVETENRSILITA